MADLFIVKIRLKVALGFVGTSVIGGALATWNAGRQAGPSGGEERFLLSATITGALVLAWVALLIVYLSAKRVMEPERGKQYRQPHFPWWTLKYAVLLAFIATMAVIIHGLAARVATEFTLLEKGNLPALQERIAEDPAVLERTDRKTGKKLLLLALENEQLEAIGLLLSNGAELESTTNGQSWVVAALPNPPLLETLLIHNVNPDALDANGLAPIHYAVQTQNTNSIALLLKYGADTNVRNTLYQTPLLLAIMADDLPSAEILFEYGVDPDLRDRDGDTALHKAVRHENMETTRFLLQRGASPKLFNFFGMAPLHIAALNGQDELLEFLLEQQPTIIGLHNEGDRTALDYALRGRKHETVQLLLRHGADIDRIFDNGYTAIHLLLIAKEYESVRLLIREGANVYIAAPEGETAYNLIRRKKLQGLLDLVEEQDNPAPSPTNTIESSDMP